MPRLNQVSARALGARQFTDTSWRVFCSPREVRFTESEYAVPRDALRPVMEELMGWIAAERERAEIGVVVANPASPGIPPLAGEDSSGKTRGRIIRTHAEGPAGWAEAVNAILDDLATTKDP